MKKSLFTTAALTLAFAAGLAFQPLPATASPCGDGPRWEHGRHHDGFEGRRGAWLAETLDLSADQQEQVRAITEEHRTKVAPLRQSLKENREQLRQVGRTKAFDETAIRAVAESQATTKIELAVERARLQHRIHAVLTPEQQEKAEKLLSERSHERGHRHGGPPR